MSQLREPLAPHLDPTRWRELIDSFDAATIVVVLTASLGPLARAAFSLEDAWQETLWLAWRDRHQHQWVNLTAYRAWLLGIARHRIIDRPDGLERARRHDQPVIGNATAPAVASAASSESAA